MTLWIPPSARISKAGEKRYNCLTCGQNGVDQEHVISCSHEHADVEEGIVRSALNRDGSVWNGLPVDEELEGWVARNRRALIEKRLKL